MILPETPGSPSTRFRAVARTAESTGDTPGAALDALTQQVGESETGTMVVIQELRPDQFFTAAQQNRLGELMALWRAARDAGTALAPEQQAELESLVDAELEGATRRAAAMSAASAGS